MGDKAVISPFSIGATDAGLKTRFPQVQQAGRKGDMGSFPFVAVE